MESHKIVWQGLQLELFKIEQLENNIAFNIYFSMIYSLMGWGTNLEIQPILSLPHSCSQNDFIIKIQPILR